MFKISTKADYALIIMLELAKHPKLSYLALSSIAKKMKISASYLTQIAQPLVKANLVISKEGQSGGLRLARSARQISILDILEAIDGGAKLKCFQSGAKACPSIKLCGVKSAWLIIIDDIKISLKKRRLSDLC